MRDHSQKHVMTQRFGPLGVIGWPIAHTLSPTLHNAAFSHLGWQDRHVYTALPVRPQNLPTALQGLRALGFVGCNVTVPHKEAVYKFVMSHEAHVSAVAKAAGAVNTLAFDEQGTVMAHNTDVGGFLAALQQKEVPLPGLRAVILGAGGAARAVALALALGGAAEIVVVNRTEPRAAELVTTLLELRSGGSDVASDARSELNKDLRDFVSGEATMGPPESGTWPTCRALKWDRPSQRGGRVVEALGRADLLVNCTPIGLAPHVSETPLTGFDLQAVKAGALVFDTIYRPRETRLMALARQRGLDATNGLAMLVAQACLAWKPWFGISGPADVMQRAAEHILQAELASGAEDPE